MSEYQLRLSTKEEITVMIKYSFSILSTAYKARFYGSSRSESCFWLMDIVRNINSTSVLLFDSIFVVSIEKSLFCMAISLSRPVPLHRPTYKGYYTVKGGCLYSVDVSQFIVHQYILYSTFIRATVSDQFLQILWYSFIVNFATLWHPLSLAAPG